MERFVFNFIGIIGVVLILVAFFFLQLGKISSQKFLYPFLNMLGAIGILISLIYEWNPSAFLIESAWVLISIYGLVKYAKQRKKV